MINELDKNIRPTKEQLIDIVQNHANLLLKDICKFAETELGATEQIDYSVCSGAPGWNLKYKKSSKSLCVIYPEAEKVIILVTISGEVLSTFEIIKSSFSAYTVKLADSVVPFNGAKWLMINVSNQDICNDVKNLIRLKAPQPKKK